MRRGIIFGLVGVFAIFVLVTYFFFDPTTEKFFPKCPFLMLTGLKCPGCGSQRAIHSLLTGDIGMAWHYNAILVIFIPIVALYTLTEIKRERWQKLYVSLNDSRVVIGIFVVLIAWWILRNVVGW